MDIYWSQPPKVFTFIKIIVWLLITVIIVGIVLVFTLKIHETVSFQTGQLLSRNAPLVYYASSEAKVKRIYVKEGDLVQQGDTLMVLQNERLLASYHKAKENYWLSLANINLIEKQIANLESKIAALQSQERIIDAEFYTQSSSHTMELSALQQEIQTLKESIEISESRLQKDKDLMAEGVISPQVYQEKYQVFLTKKNELTNLQKQFNLRQSSKKGLGHAHSEQKHQWSINLLANDYEYVNLKKMLLEEEARNQEEENTMKMLLQELNRLTIVAEIRGHISGLFNMQQFSNFITKGTALLTLTSLEEEAFFAKVTIPQEGISKVTQGQIVHLKLDAYNHYYHGILRGTIEHIARQDTSANFYALAAIDSEHPGFDLKSGFRVKGDILIKETRLNRFLWEKMLEK